jgi:hypothetical protein
MASSPHAHANSGTSGSGLAVSAAESAKVTETSGEMFALEFLRDQAQASPSGRVRAGPRTESSVRNYPDVRVEPIDLLIQTGTSA